MYRMPGSELSSTPTDYATSLIASTSLSSTTANIDLENEAMYHLIRDNAAQNVTSLVSNTDYSNITTSFECKANNYNSTELNTCDISTTPGLHDGSIVVSTYHNQSDSIATNDSQTLNIGNDTCVNTINITVDEPTNSIYDSHLQITAATNNDGPYIFENLLDNAFEATLTNGGSNQELHKIFNSKYGNTSGLNKIYVQEDVSFNRTFAMGNVRDKYFSFNSSNGTRNVNDLPNLNMAFPNNINIVNANMADINITDCGTYRIQQLPDSTNIEVYNNDELVDDSSVSDIPIHTKNTLGYNNTNLTRLPVDPLTPPQFRSIFDRTQDIILPEYEFKVEVTKNDDDKSGIGFNEDTDIKTNPLMELDNRYLTENPYFIQNFAGETGRLIFQPATVAVDTSSNGFQTNITNGSFELDSGREKLMKDFYNKNGQIILNKGTTLTRTIISQNTTSLLPEISYEREYPSYISEEDKLNHYVDYKAQLVFKNPINDTNFISNNTSALNLIFDNSVVNGSFDSSEWQMTSENALSNTNEVWKIVPKIRLHGVEALKDSTGTAVPSMFSNAFIENILVPLSEGSFSAKAVIGLRSVSSLSFYNDFSMNGWQLSSSNGGLLEASSIDAFYPENSSYFPDPVQMYDLVDGSGGPLPFTVRFNPGISNSINSSLASDFSDRVEITWGNSNTIKIHQQQLTKINKTSSVTNTIIDPSLYSLTGYLSGKSVQITKYTSVKNYQIQFNLGLRSYSTLTATSPMYTIESEYYIGTDTKTGEIYPSGLLSLAVSNLGIDFTKINETVTSETALSVSSQIEYNDVKELIAEIQIENGDGDWSSMSESIYISSFYSKAPTQFNLIPIYDSSLNGSDISILINYQYHHDEDNPVVLNDQDGYYIDLNNSYDNSSFDLYSWASSVENTGSNSSIDNNELFISPSNGFSSIQSNWANPSPYRLEVSYTSDDVTDIVSDDSTTILRIIKASDNSLVHTVTIQNNTAIGTPIYISRSPSIDTWSIVKTIGNSLATATSTERFMSTNYSDSQGRLNSFQITNGVQLIRASLNLGNSEDCGNLIRFSLLSDMIGVNMTGDVTLPLNRILWTGPSTDTTAEETSENGLNFRAHRNFNTYSKSLTIRYYRGYLGLQNVNQIYTVTREVTKATVKWEKVTGTPKSYEQRDIECFHRSVPLDYEKGDVLDNSLYSANFVDNMMPRDASGSIVFVETAFTDIGLLLLPEYSMLADDDDRDYPIYTKGDSIQITISNPNNTLTTPIYPVTINKTLKDYALYNFSGANYNSTGESLNLYSTKLKSDSNMKYTLSLIAGNMSIYKNDNYLGNPVSRGQVDPLVDTSPTNWGTVITQGSYRDNLVGLIIPGHTIKRVPNRNYIEAVTFFVIHAPMHKFNVVPFLSCPTSIPIDDSITDQTLSSDFSLIKQGLQQEYKLVVDNIIARLREVETELTMDGISALNDISTTHTTLTSMYTSIISVSSRSQYNAAISTFKSMELLSQSITDKFNLIINNAQTFFTSISSPPTVSAINYFNTNVPLINTKFNDIEILVLAFEISVSRQIVGKVYFLPVTDKLSAEDTGPKYNPFMASRVWTNIDDTSVTVTNNNSEINDVMFYHKNPRHASDFVISENPSIRLFNIPTSNIIINLYSKLKSETSPTLLTTLYDGYASDLLLLDSSSNPLGTTPLRLSNTLVGGTGAQLSFLQSGIPPFLISSSNIFGISNNTNVTFTIPFFFLGSLITPIKLDLPTGPGTILNMYTRSIQKDISNGATKIVLYKYIPMGTIVDWNNSILSDKTIINAIFNSRYKKVFSLPERTLNQTVIQTFDALIDLIPKSEIASATWQHDISFNNQVRFTFSSFNLDCIQKTLPKFMSPPNNLGHAKFNIVTRTKALQVKDKFGFPLADIDHDGIIRVNTISTGTIILNDVDLSNPDSLNKVNKRPVVTFGRGVNI